jgi:hypothetical protein
MTRNLKTLGLALVAVFAMSAVAASSASALHFVGGTGISKWDGVQVTTNVFTTNGVKTECDDATFTGTVAASTTTEQTVIPVFGKCRFASKTVNATIHMNGCAFILTIPNAPPASNPVHIECPTTKEGGVTHNGIDHTDLIIVTVPGLCEKTIPEQTPTSGGVVYETGTSGGKKDITMTANITGIHYTTHGLCQMISGKPTDFTWTDGTYTGKITFTGTNAAGGAVDIEAT